MAKKLTIPLIDEYKPELVRSRWRKIYQKRFFSLFCSIFDFGKLVTPEERMVILKYFWEGGSFSVTRSPSPAEAFEKEMDIVFTKYAIDDYDFNIQPLHFHNVPYQSSAAVSEKTMEVGKDGVIVYLNEYSRLHPNYGARRTAEQYIKQIVSIKMTENTNLLLHKLPFLIACDDDAEATFREMLRQIFSDVPAVFAPRSVQGNEPKGMNLQTPYIIDKLEAYVTKLENMFLDEIAIDNVKPIQQGQDRLTLDETNANNSLINHFGSGIFTTVNEGFEEVEKLFGRKIRVKRAGEKQVVSVHENINGNKPE